MPNGFRPIRARRVDVHGLEHVPVDGQVSLTFRLVFQRTDRNLTDSEIVKATDRVVNLLAHRFGGELREG